MHPKDHLIIGSNGAVMKGTTDIGNVIDVPVTPEGHPEFALHEPLTVFGDVSVAEDTPIFQFDFPYDLNPSSTRTFTSGSGAVTMDDSCAKLSLGATIYSYAVLESRKRLRYRPGQGVVGAFTWKFDTPVANSFQGAGFGTSENGVYFNYGYTDDLSDTRFGILYTRRGKREIKTLTVTAGASSPGNVTVTLNGVANTVAVTGASNIQRTAWEISQGTYAGWLAYPSGATVVFIRSSSGVTAGTQSFSAGTTGATASIVQTRAGVAAQETFYPQDEWNLDTLDGQGPSGFDINPQKVNIYRILIGYLGVHDILLQVRISVNGNNPTWVTCHRIPLINQLETTSFSNGSFPFNAFVYSAGSTTDLVNKCGSVYGGIEGKKILHGPRICIDRAITTVTAGAYHALFTILNPLVFNGVSNQSVINLVCFTGALKHTNPCNFYLIKNGSLVGNPNFAAWSANTVCLYDNSATSCTISDNEQILYAEALGDTGNFSTKFIGEGTFNAEEFTIQPGEWVTVAARSATGSPSYVTGILNARVDR